MSAAANPDTPHPKAKELVEAAANGEVSKARALLAAGVPVDARDSESYKLGASSQITALMCAAHQGNLELTKLLLAAGASVAAACHRHKADGGGGSQALHFAVVGKNPAVMEALLDAGADPNVLGNSSRTPLTIAIYEKIFEAVPVLLKRGANAALKPKSKDYDPPLYAVAAILTNTSSLVARGKKLVMEVEELWARKDKVFQLFQQLLDAGAGPNSANGRGETPLTRLSCGYEVPDEIRIPLMQKLLSAGAEPDKSEPDGGTALQMAALYIAPNSARLLYQAGANINRVFKRGTALDIAEQHIKLFEEDLAEPGIRADFLAVMQTKLARAQELAKVLSEFGAKPKAELETAALVPAPLPALAAARATSIGAADFLKFIYNGEAEWSLLAVQAPFNKVADAFEKFSKAKKRNRDVPIRAAAGEGDELAEMIAVLQIGENPWTVIYRTLYRVTEASMTEVVKAAKELSRQLKTKATSFVGEDISGALGYDLFENGKLLERAGWEEGGAFSEFESTSREEPELESVGQEFADEVFQQLGIYLPACYPKTAGKRSWLAVEESSTDRIERADLLSL